MKMQIVGFEGSSGMGKTSGKAYAIGQLHTLANLAPAFSDTGISSGQMGTTYRCPLPLIEKIKNVRPPFVAEVEVGVVMRFGKREEEVIDIAPVSVSKAAA
jgi:hypothetical protein